MKKYCLSLHLKFLLLFITSLSFGQVTNVISDLKVNNITATQINFASNSTVNVTFKVKLQTFNGSSDNLFGNIFIYTKKSTDETEIQRSFSSVTFTVSNSPFVPQTTYNSEIPFTVSIPADEFNANGGVLYAEYRNNNGQKYKSSNVNIVNTPPVINPILNSYFKIESIKYADTGREVEDEQVLIHNGNSSVSLNISYAYWKSTGSTLCGDKFTYVRDRYNGSTVAVLNNGTIQQFPSSPCLTTIDTIRGNMPTFNIPISQVNGKQHINIFYTPKDQPLGTGGTLGAKLIFRIAEFTGTDIIAMRSQRGDEAPITSIGSSVAKISLSEAFKQDYSTINATVLYIDKFEWYSRPLNGSTWIRITEPQYDDLKALAVTTQFFKRSTYKGIYKDSNIVTIEPLPVVPDPQEIEIENTICCNQTVALGTPFTSVVGNVITPSRSLSASYQWQKSINGVIWTDIGGAISKDLTLQSVSSISTAIYYRRAIITSKGNNYSGYVKLSVVFPFEHTNLVSEDNVDSVQINIYPNPSFDVLSIESENNISGSLINVYDSYGNKKNVSKSNYTDTRINLNINDLPIGLYLLVIENENGSVTKQFIKK